MVRVASSSGFCEGVRRAFALAEHALGEGKPVFLLGELIHNHDAMAALCAKGAKLVFHPEDIPPGGTVVTRSHGVPRALAEHLARKEVKVVDTTCPKVKRVQVLARKLEEEGYRICLFGEPSHPEVQALLSYLEREVTILSGRGDWEKVLSGDDGHPVAVLAQTTFPRSIFEEFATWVKAQHLSWVRIVPTLCGETEARQKELVRALEERPEDVVIVVGGKHSANTRSLFTTAREKKALVFWVENLAELKTLSLPRDRSFFVISGTSTPDWVVAEVVAYLEHEEAAG